MKKLIVDGKNAVFGRMASIVAKELLKGNFVDVINCDDIIVSGDKRIFAKKVRAKREMGSGGSMKGPQYIRLSDRLIKRMIRGMLPWDVAKGRDAFRRLKCHVGNGDAEIEGKEVITFEHKMPMKYSTIKEIMKLIK